MTIKTSFKNFCKYPTDENIINELSEELYQIAQKAYLRKLNQKKRKNELMGRFDDPIDIGADDYTPAILFDLIDELGDMVFLRNSKKNVLIQQMANHIMPQLVDRITSLEECDNKKLPSIMVAWASLTDLLHRESDLRPSIKIHHDFKKEIYNLNSYNSLLPADEPKKVITEGFVKETQSLVNNHLEDLYWLYTDPAQSLKLKQKSEELGRKLHEKSAIVLPQLEEHRHRRSIRLLGKITLAVSAIVTAGLALIGKMIYSKFTTGHGTVFQNHTRSAGKALTTMRKAGRLRNLVPVPKPT